MESPANKEYKKGDLTVVWEVGKCIHSGKCVKALPNVYKPKEQPWINVDKASQEELISQIKTCPSGALSYYLDKK